MNNIKQSLIWAKKYLKTKKITSANLDTEVILSFILKKEKSFLYTYPEKTLNKKQIEKFKNLIKKRGTYFPVAYIIGKKEFYGSTFKINQTVLIPRPDSEILVEEVLKTVKKRQSTIHNQQLAIAEIGTGSGCLIISILKNLPENLKVKAYATDICKRALKVAEFNTTKLLTKKLSPSFSCGDLIEPLKNKKIDILIANLPYLKNNLDYYKSPDLKFEPKKALTAGFDGLDLYKKLFSQITKLKHKPKFIFIEIADEQTVKIKKIIKKNLPQSRIRILKDLKGLNRIVKISL